MMSVAFHCSHGYQESFVYTMEESLCQTDSGMHKHGQQEEPVHRARSPCPLTVTGKESEFRVILFYFLQRVNSLKALSDFQVTGCLSEGAGRAF